MQEDAHARDVNRSQPRLSNENEHGVLGQVLHVPELAGKTCHESHNAENGSKRTNAAPKPQD